MQKKNWQKLLLSLFAFILISFGLLDPTDIFNSEGPNPTSEVASTPETTVVEGETYDTPHAVATYIEYYGELPENYLTKEEARRLGWDPQAGNLWEVAPGASIGGNYFGNYEELLPEAPQRDYYEADIEYEGGHRNAKRLVFSNDGLYFYTEDHYESFDEIEVGDNE